MLAGAGGQQRRLACEQVQGVTVEDGRYASSTSSRNARSRSRQGDRVAAQAGAKHDGVSAHDEVG